jgi:hypothetical protein
LATRSTETSVEVLIGHCLAKAQAEHFVHRRSRLSAHTSTTADVDRRRAARNPNAGADGAEVDLGLLDSPRQFQRGLKHAHKL